MFKIIFLIVIALGFIAYTGIDVSTEYGALSKTRMDIFENVIDPLVKKILAYVSESNFNLIVDNTIKKYGENK
jgi:hypothetical protein